MGSRQILIRFTSYSEKLEMLQRIKNSAETNVTIELNCNMETRKVRRELLPYTKDTRSKGNTVYLLKEKLVVKRKTEEYRTTNYGQSCMCRRYSNYPALNSPAKPRLNRRGKEKQEKCDQKANGTTRRSITTPRKNKDVPNTRHSAPVKESGDTATRSLRK
jgi:hypothetical protein